MLIKIEAIVREEKFEQVKSALQDIQVNGVTISQVLPAKSVTEKFSAMKSAALSKSAQKRPVIMQFSHKIIFNLPGNHSSICDFPVSLFQHDPVCTKGTH